MLNELAKDTLQDLIQKRKSGSICSMQQVRQHADKFKKIS
jgi:hypothetical protein